MRGSSAVAAPMPASDRLVRTAERGLRVAGDGRVGLALLLATGALNGLAAVLPDGPALLDAPPYAALLGAVALSGVAAVAVRAPAAWREWRTPGAVPLGMGALTASIPGIDPVEVRARLLAAGYRLREERGRGRWAAHGVRRGWSRFAGITSHLALVVVVLGAAIGAAFGSETTFSLLPGEQALLDAPRPGFAAAVRLERLDAQFGVDGRPRRLDTQVTFVRDGLEVRTATLRVNEPADFDGYLVHPWTYGPAARVRITALDGAPLLHGTIPLDGLRDAAPVGAAEIPTAGVTLGLALSDAAANELGVSVLDGEGLVDAVRLRPGDERRVGELIVRLEGFDAWVTLLSRRDPGLGVLFAGAAALCASLAIAFWLPRRRMSARLIGERLELTLRGERFDRPVAELDRLRDLLSRPA